jgi:hypothetical protein
MISTLCTLLDNSASTAAWAGADFEHNVVGLEFKQVGHHCNRQRLRDRLIEAYRERPIQVGIMLNLDRHKLVPRDFGQCAKDAPVQRCPANLGGTAAIARPNSPLEVRPGPLIERIAFRCHRVVTEHSV